MSARCAQTLPEWPAKVQEFTPSDLPASASARLTCPSDVSRSVSQAVRHYGTRNPEVAGSDPELRGPGPPQLGVTFPRWRPAR
jgi:hypothetical protein